MIINFNYTNLIFIYSSVPYLFKTNNLYLITFWPGTMDQYYHVRPSQHQHSISFKGYGTCICQSVILPQYCKKCNIKFSTFIQQKAYYNPINSVCRSCVFRDCLCVLNWSQHGGVWQCLLSFSGSIFIGQCQGSPVLSAGSCSRSRQTLSHREQQGSARSPPTRYLRENNPTEPNIHTTLK